MKKDWIWMGHAGHFIGATKCRFHLNTYVNGYIISTVGEYWPSRSTREANALFNDAAWFEKNRNLKGDNFEYAYIKKFGFMDIGMNRKYETIVFKAQKSKHKCCPYKIIVEEVVESCFYNKVDTAQKGHYKLCEKYDSEMKERSTP